MSLAHLAARVFGTDTWIMGHCNDGAGQRVVTVYEGNRHYDGVGHSTLEAEIDLTTLLERVLEIRRVRAERLARNEREVMT